MGPPHRYSVVYVCVLPPDATAKPMVSSHHLTYPQSLSRLASNLRLCALPLSLRRRGRLCVPPDHRIGRKFTIHW